MGNETSAPITTTELNQERVDFGTRDFKQLVHQKGLKLTHEKAVQCPCRVEANGNASPNCVSCKGSGWQYKDSEEIRGVIQSVMMNPKIAESVRMDAGTATITTNESDKLAWHDRLTLVDGESIYSENLYITENTTWYDYSTYLPEEIEYALLFIDDETPTSDISAYLTVVGRKVTLDLAGAGLSGEQSYQVSIRYTHKPQYYVVDIQKDIRNTRKIQGGGVDELENLPVNGIIRKVHYVID